MAQQPPKLKKGMATVGTLKTMIDSLKKRNQQIDFEKSNIPEDSYENAWPLLKEFQQNSDKIKKYNSAIKIGLQKRLSKGTK